jgi:formylglycine-generating enzyme required for sulfatase activity
MMDQDLEAYFRKHRLDNYGRHFLSVRSMKLYFDGALGSRGAAFFKPYNDDPGNTGLLRIPQEYITKVARAALKTGMGVNTHCIGIRGNRLCLDAYEKALKEFPTPDHRFRIEHAQVVRQEDADKFAALGVIPSMQPTHCTSDMYFVEDRIGKKRAEGAYAWQWFRKAKLKIPMGSDFPVESNNPLYGIYAAITRQDHKEWPENGWYPRHRVLIREAIKGFTIWAAYAAFQEKVLGSIEPGKLADFTILDRDITGIQPKDILKTKVLYTIVGGKIRYQAGKVKAETVLIPGGEFIMGRTSMTAASKKPGAYIDDTPHKVVLDSFYIDKYEVTNAQYFEFCNATGHKLPELWGKAEYHCGPAFPDHPVVGVSYNDAAAYAAWRGKRLPTEAEWEYAARGGLTRKKYPNGDTISKELANCKPHATGAMPVGRFPANGFGLHDTVGNVVEWVADYFDRDYYKHSPAKNPKGPLKGKHRVIRGGGWHSGPFCNRVHYRNCLVAGWLDFNLGFRCAKDAAPSKK